MLVLHKTTCGQTAEMEENNEPNQASLKFHVCTNFMDMQYYGITGYSMRDAMHQAVEDNPALRQQIWWSPPDTDRIHPTCVGSRYS